MSLTGAPHNQGGLVKVVRTNMFQMTRMPIKTFYQYDVVIKHQDPEKQTRLENSPRGLPRARSLDIVSHMQAAHANVFTNTAAFDGVKNMYTVLANLTGSYTVTMPGRGGRGHDVFVIRLQRVAETSQEALRELVEKKQTRTDTTQAAVTLLQQILQAGPKLMHPCHNARSVFPGRLSKKPLGHGLEAWRGFFHSVRPSVGRTLVNVDTTTTAVHQAGRLYDIALSLLDRPGGDLRMLEELDVRNRVTWNKMRSFFKSVKVEVVFPNGKTDGRARPIAGLVPRAGSHVFEMRKKKEEMGREMTVREYYREQHGIDLKLPKLFGVRLGKDAVIPGELCMVIPNHLYRGKVPPEAMPAMLGFAELSPDKKIHEIEQAVSGQDLGYGNSMFLADAGIVIDNKPLEVEAIELPAPQIKYKDNSTARPPRDGAWNVLNQKFFEPMKLKKWAIINYAPDCSDSVVHNFVGKLIQNLGNLGMMVRPEPPILRPNGTVVHQDMIQAATRCGGTPSQPPDLVVVILRMPAPDIRSKVKFYGDTQYHFPTQCVTSKKLMNARGLDQYVNNVALKINAKLGGRNSLPFDENLDKILVQKSSMIFGADVSHPGPGLRNRPSIASLVWTTDFVASKWGSSVRIQEPRTEIISEMKDMVQSAFKSWFIHNQRNPPKTVIMFRDGVSEGEYDQVRDAECAAIREAMAASWVEQGAPPNAPKPALIFIVVGKRHHVRLFPKGNPGTKSGNLPPGMLVYRSLSSPYVEDWYMLSHGGLKGTSVPAHYVLLCNETQIPVRALAALAYSLCYAFARATRSVSIPAPVYYADILCSRAEFQFHPERVPTYDDDATSSTSDSFNLQRWKDAFVPVLGKLAHSFYYL